MKQASAPEQVPEFHHSGTQKESRKREKRKTIVPQDFKMGRGKKVILKELFVEAKKKQTLFPQAGNHQACE